MLPQPRRVQLIIENWFDALAAAAVGTAVALLVTSVAGNTLTFLLRARGWTYASAAVCLVLLCHRAASRKWRAFLGLHHGLSYPPIWIPGLLGGAVFYCVVKIYPAVVATLLRSTTPAATPYDLAMGGVGFLGAVLFAALDSWVSTTTRRRTALGATGTRAVNAATVTSPETSFPGLVAWLQDDSEIHRPDQDQFDHATIARRVAHRLMDERPPAQAIIGRLGSGKTSLGKLVKAALEEASVKRVQIVSVELWPYDTSHAAVEGVIRALIDELSNQVSITALRGLPEEYVAAMSSAGGLWSAATKLQGAPSSPLGLLRKIDDIATAIGLRYVVWIDDLERFAGVHASIPVESLELTEERLNPIRSLLWGLGQLHSVTVITATTNLRIRFDIEKIARFVEEIPEIPAHLAARLLARFRAGCRQQYTVFDPADSAVRKDLDALEMVSPGLQRARDLMLVDRIGSVADSAAYLCSTPRTLKQALRRAYDTWRELPGEIDFDDLLLMSLLRAALPDVFALVSQHISVLRSSSGAALADRQKKMMTDWKVALRAIKLDAQSTSAVDKIIEFVFQRRRGKPQGLWQTAHADYWQRFLSVPKLEKDERDQDVLDVLRAADDDALILTLENERRADTAVTFGDLVPDARLHRLLVPLIERRVMEDVSTWAEADPAGLVALSRMWWNRVAQHGVVPSIAFEQVCLALAKSVSRNLRLTASVVEYFVARNGDVRMLQDDKQSYFDKVMVHLHGLLATTYAGKPDDLAENLIGNDKSPTLALVSLGGRLGKGAAAGLAPSPNWRGFSETILEAARTHPAELIPQLADLVTLRVSALFRRATGEGAKFDTDAATTLFVSADVVLDVFAAHDGSKWIGDAAVEAVFRAVQERNRSRG